MKSTRNGNARGDHVDRARHDGRDEGVKAHIEDFDVVARLVANSADEIHVEARVFLRLRIEEFEGRKSGLSADAQQVAGFTDRSGKTAGNCTGADDKILELHD